VETTTDLSGALIDRIDRPLPGLYALRLVARSGPEVLLLAAGPPRSALAWGLVPERPRGDPADPEVRGFREKLEGGRIAAAFRTRRSFGLVVTRGDLVLWMEGTPRGLVVVPSIEGAIPEGDEITADEVAAARVRGVRMVEEHRALLEIGERRAAEVALKKLRDRLARRVAAIESDLASADRADELARFAALFVPAAAASGPAAGISVLRAVDWSSGTAVPVELPLDPARPPRAQLEAMFARAKRLRSGARVAEARWEEAMGAIERIDEALKNLAATEGAEPVRSLLASIQRALPADLRIGSAKPRASRREKPEPPKPYRAYTSESGAPIWVGKDARSNDELTVRNARPGDLFLHARGVKGAHVIVPGWWKDGRLDPGTLVDAATLAAHFSDARGESLVEVSYADRRHVRKRRGTPAGLVEVEREKVLPLRVEPDRLARLLKTAEPGR
jgi:hypothetical protein